MHNHLTNELFLYKRLQILMNNTTAMAAGEKPPEQVHGADELAQIDEIYHRIASILPKKLVHWCVVIVFAKTTANQYSDTIASELTVIDALRRFDA